MISISFKTMGPWVVIFNGPAFWARDFSGGCWAKATSPTYAKNSAALPLVRPCGLTLCFPNRKGVVCGRRAKSPQIEWILFHELRLLQLLSCFPVIHVTTKL
jgi:hypothetical protein